ncbi:MAG: transposase [Rickettsiaceae bacterium]
MSKRIEQNASDIDDKLVEELLSKADPSKLFGRGGLFNKLKKQIVERVLESELDHELGYSRHSKDNKSSDNRRNGSYGKTIIDDDGHKLNIEVPRDRGGEYAPQLIPKGVRRFSGFDDKVISLYARGMTMREIQGYLEEIYHTDVSKELISKVTDGVIDEVSKWQHRARALI